MLFDRPISLTDALRHQSLKRVLAVSPSTGTFEIESALAPQIRERAFYSARTPYAGYLADTQRMIQNLVQPDARIGPDGLVPTGAGESISPAQVRARMRRMLEALGYEPDPALRGGLLDLSSDRRINLIIDTQVKMSLGYGQWRQGQDTTVLDLWPADELYRAIEADEKRDWDLTWNEARSSLGPEGTTATYALDRDAGPFVALKNDAIWTAISRFGNPYPPFDFGSGMRVRDVSRERAESLGVLAEADPPPPPAADTLNAPFEQDARNVPAPLLQALVETLGGMARVAGTRLIIDPAAGGPR